MNSTDTETVADVLAEIRDAATSADAWRAGMAANVVMDYADRVETAARCERDHAVEHATRHAEAVARDNCRDCVHNPRGKNYEGGNAAAMREALERLLHGEYRDRCEVTEIAHAALSAPARNCDLYASATEALKAQDVAFNEDNFKNGECKLGCPGCDDGLIDCKVLWLFAPAEKRKGESDGGR